ncbi:MAG: hypothetical protein IT437_01695 [Phycisphaerales bacterium]|nr:hypothetical protein [Phycisphaerales bacterium]
MASSFKGLDLFGSGPHRFALRKQGELVVPELSLGSAISGSLYLGPLETCVVVTGRLVAASDAALWALRDAVTAELLDPPAPGTLIDHHGRTWTDMSFITFEPEGPTDRGRLVTLAYTAVFLDFRTYP